MTRLTGRHPSRILPVLFSTFFVVYNTGIAGAQRGTANSECGSVAGIQSPAKNQGSRNTGKPGNCNVQPAVIPPTPVVLPMPQSIEAPANTNARNFTVRWRRGAATSNQKPAPVGRYRICVFVGANCQTAHRNAVFEHTRVRTLNFTPPTGLDYRKFQGQVVSWSVAACSTAHNMLCSPYSAPQQAIWRMPRPRGLRARIRSTGDAGLEFNFDWTDVHGAAHFFICLTLGEASRCLSEPTFREADPWVKMLNNARYSTRKPLAKFRGRSLQWRVAACPNAPAGDDRCTWSLSKSIVVPNPMSPPRPKTSVHTDSNIESLTFRWTNDHQIGKVSHQYFCLLQTFPGLNNAHFCNPRQNGSQTYRLPANQTSCLMRRPFFGNPDAKTGDAVGAAVATCNAQNECAWSKVWRIQLDGLKPFSWRTRCN